MNNPPFDVPTADLIRSLITQRESRVDHLDGNQWNETLKAIADYIEEIESPFWSETV